MGMVEFPGSITSVSWFFKYFEPTYVQIGQMVWEHHDTRDEKMRKELQLFYVLELIRDI